MHLSSCVVVVRRLCLPCLYRSVVLALLASVPWALALGTHIRYHKRLPLVNPLAKLFFSPQTYHEIATLLPRPQISPYSNIKPRHLPTRTTAEQISTARKRSQKSLRQAQRAEARREKLQYRREQRKQARPRTGGERSEHTRGQARQAAQGRRTKKSTVDQASAGTHTGKHSEHT